MKRSLWMLTLAACALFAAASAQDPLKVAPQAYKLEFENEWVMVTRVHYGPREKISEHDHTERSSAYVYLNDGGPIIFKHINLPYADITRKETKAGSFRVYKGLKEVHAVENPTDIPSDFLRVEFKTEPVNDKSLHGKFYREPYPPGENFRKVQFENEQIRITRLVIAARGEMDVSANATEPALLVALTPARLEARGRKIKTARVNLEPGKTHWLGINQQQQLKNAGENDAELLRFEFKTRPVAGQSKPHDHDHSRY
ncbi:MAG: hypothetical protein ACREEM_22930 [Blastocatellia bacterium]